jgi:hypothetical protein
MKTLTKYAGIIFITVSMALPAAASENHGLVREQLKTALNGMVQEVKKAESPAEKRAIMARFVHKAGRGAGMAENLPLLSQEKHAALDMLQGKFSGYALELTGTGSAGVADKDLDAFASFMQQDLEQAESSWSSGGIYLSTGAVIIILLILILIT